MKTSPIESIKVTDGVANQHRLVEVLNAGYIHGVATGDGQWFQENLADDFFEQRRGWGAP